MNDYKVICEPPNIEAYMELRNKTTLSVRKRESVSKGLNNCWYGVHITCNGKTVGMGRIVGDGGITFQIVDIAVLPNHQGNGLGKMIMTALLEYYNKNAPTDAYLCLIADGDAKYLYEKFGFTETAPLSVGMKYNPK